MIFVKDLGEELISAYNSNVIVYDASDSRKSVDSSVITSGDLNIERTPNLKEQFNFNITTVVKSFLNQNNFNDEIKANLKNSLVYLDSNLYKELNFSFKIKFTDGTEEVESKQYKFLNSVIQGALFDNRLCILKPHNSTIINLTYFDGYPFDIPIYSNEDREIIVVNKNTQLQIKINLKKGVNRLFFSDGKTNTSLIDKLHLYTGINELEFRIASEVIYTIMLKKETSTCGNYFKWFNKNGGYSCWLFPLNYSISEKSKEIASINKENSNNILITGKNGNKTFKTVSQHLSESEYNYLKEIETSPRVFFYKDKRFLNYENWIDVKVKSNLNYLSKNRLQKIAIEVELPNLNTQTL